MPPKSTRKTSASASRATQGTLAFGAQKNRITKPTTASAHAKKPTTAPTAIKDPSTSKPKAARAADVVTATPSPVPEDAQEDPGLSPRKALVIRKQAASPRTTATTAAAAVGKKRDEKEEKAGKISEAQVQRYWKGKEEERIAPRVHQEGLGVHEKVLREFDMSSHFGPCIGIPRIKRWKRADGLGLKPPLEVLAVLLKEDSAGNVRAERAFMDGLLTSRLVENE